jgi:hypothetical protein
MKDSSSAGIKHLKRKHKIYKQGKRIKSSQTTLSAAVSTAGTAISTGIVTMHIALTCVESETFRDWVLYVVPALDKYLVESGDSIRRWIIREFERQRLEIKKQLTRAHSRIHVSFDLWTSANGKGLVGVVFHYLDDNLKVCNLLAGMNLGRNLYSIHSFLHTNLLILVLNVYSKYPKRTSRPSGLGVPDHRVGFLLMTRPNPLVRTTAST